MLFFLSIVSDFIPSDKTDEILQKLVEKATSKGIKIKQNKVTGHPEAVWAWLLSLRFRHVNLEFTLVPEPCFNHDEWLAGELSRTSRSWLRFKNAWETQTGVPIKDNAK